nr:hypothetical protein [Tanacetum cinerariifolium]GFC09049.1 hypothetical protein [Tanacetum cinerariifolium]
MPLSALPHCALLALEVVACCFPLVEVNNLVPAAAVGGGMTVVSELLFVFWTLALVFGESRINDQDVNTAGTSINTVSTNVNIGSLNINTVSLSVTTAPLEATHADHFGDETKVDMSNIYTTYLVPSIPNTRIHKDHSLDNVIDDVQSGVQTRRMTKTTNEQGFISVVYKGKAHEDLHTYLFA